MSEKNKISRYVLDSYALLAYLQDEPGAARVKAVLEQAEKEQAEVFLAIINFGEVVYIIEREKGLTIAQTTIATLDLLPLVVIEADRLLTFEAAHIKAKHSLSYADAFAVALAKLKQATILTGDREFATVEKETSIEWLPAK